MSERLSYRFGPLERRGILGPVRAGQAATIAVGALLAIAILDRAATVTGAALATITFGTLVLIALAPVGRRTAEEWAPVIAAFALRRLLRRSRFRSPLPTRGLFADERSAPKRRTIAEPRPEIPRELHGVSIAQIGYRDRSIGVIREQRRPAADRGARVPRGRLLAARSRGAGATARAVGAGARGRRRHVACGGSSGSNAPPRPRATSWRGGCTTNAIRPCRYAGTPMIESYLELIGDDGAGHPGARDPGRGPGRRPPRARARRRVVTADALVEQTERIAQGLEAAEVDGARSAQRGPARARAAHRVRPLLPARSSRRSRRPIATATASRQANAWPLGAREAWDHYRSDGAVHATLLDRRAGRASTSRRCSWTRCSAARAPCARWR